MATGVTLDSASAFSLLQPSFEKGVQDLNNNDVFFFNTLDEDQGGSFDGTRYNFAVGTQRVASLRGIPQVGGHYPPAGTTNDVVGSCAQVFEAGSIAYERQAEIKTGGMHSFARASARAFGTFLQHYKEELERKSLSNGSGILNILGGIGSVTGVTAANWTFTVSIWDSPKIRKGMHIQFWTCPTALNSTNWRNATPRDYPTQGYYTVANVANSASAETATITIAEASPGTSSPASSGAYANGSTSNLDFIVVADTLLENGSSDATPRNVAYEMMGLDGIACGTNGIASSAHGGETGVAWVQIGEAGGSMAEDRFENISPSTYGEWNASVINATTYGSTLGRAMLQKAMTYQNVFGSRGTDQWVMGIGHPSQINEYAQTLEGAERYSIEGPTPSSLPSGRASLHNREGMGETLKFAGIPLYGSRFSRADRFYFVNRKGIARKTLAPWSFGALHDDYTGRVAKQADGLGSYNIITKERGCLLAIHALTVPTAT